MSQVPKTATYTRAYAESKGFLALMGDVERLTGADELGPEAGERLQQATLAIRARVPLDVLSDTIQPFPTLSEIYVEALKKLRAGVAAGVGTDRRRPPDGDVTRPKRSRPCVPTSSPAPASRTSSCPTTPRRLAA